MEQSDLKEILNMLNLAVKTQDWDIIDEVRLYVDDYIDDPSELNEDE